MIVFLIGLIVCLFKWDFNWHFKPVSEGAYLDLLFSERVPHLFIHHSVCSNLLISLSSPKQAFLSFSGHFSTQQQWDVDRRCNLFMRSWWLEPNEPIWGENWEEKRFERTKAMCVMFLLEASSQTWFGVRSVNELTTFVWNHLVIDIESWVSSMSKFSSLMNQKEFEWLWTPSLM